MAAAADGGVNALGQRLNVKVACRVGGGRLLQLDGGQPRAPREEDHKQPAQSSAQALQVVWLWIHHFCVLHQSKNEADDHSKN